MCLNNFQWRVDARPMHYKNYKNILQAPVGDLYPPRANWKVPDLRANGERRRFGVGDVLVLEEILHPLDTYAILIAAG